MYKLKYKPLKKEICKATCQRLLGGKTEESN